MSEIGIERQLWTPPSKLDLSQYFDFYQSGHARFVFYGKFCLRNKAAIARGFA
jgi:hypothetical protein